MGIDGAGTCLALAFGLVTRCVIFLAVSAIFCIMLGLGGRNCGCDSEGNGGGIKSGLTLEDEASAGAIDLKDATDGVGDGGRFCCGTLIGATD